jgi:hypothetical protein
MVQVSPTRRRLFLERGAHLGALWAFAVARPLFDVLGPNPEFFVVRGWPGGRIVVFALVVALAPPLALAVLEALAELSSPRLARGLHLGLVGLLAMAIALGLFAISSTLPALALALACGVGAALAYDRLRATRSLLTVLSPAPLVFLALFLLFSDVSKLVLPEDAAVRAAGVRATAPVVLVVFDELPVHSLMDASGRIDERLYPSFARLARDSTWYRNTASVHQDTPYAVPAILDGRTPRPERLPVAADHPQSLFTLLGDRYELHVHEDATALCPPSLCHDDGGHGADGVWRDVGNVYLHLLLPDGLERHVPDVERAGRAFDDEQDGNVRTSHSVRSAGRTPDETKEHRKTRLHGNLNGGRLERFRDFIRGIHGSSRPRLDMIHMVLPHVPYQYMASGHAYRAHPQEDIPGLNADPGFDSQFLTEQAYQRHLLQLQATDRLLGELLARLRRVGLYDRALVAVVADHGISFRRGFGRRLLRRGNVRDVAPVPFFLKRPGQRHPTISDQPLQTIDVLPTIADVLGVRIPWHVDGTSALDPTTDAQRHRRIVKKRFVTSYPVDTPSWRADEQEVLQRKAQLFGGGLYAFGPRPDLLGRRLGELELAPAQKAHAQLIGREGYARVDPGSGVVPAHLLGTIVGGARGGGRTIAAAVDGRIQATGSTFTLEGDTAEQFSLMVPERTLRAGANDVQLLLVEGDELVPLGGTDPRIRH